MFSPRFDRKSNPSNKKGERKSQEGPIKWLFFVSVIGKTLTRENFSNIYIKLRREYGFDYCFHKLRNFVLDTVTKRDGLLTASKIAKHKSTSTTLGYTKDYEREQRLEAQDRFQKIISYPSKDQKIKKNNRGFVENKNSKNPLPKLHVKNTKYKDAENHALKHFTALKIVYK